MHTELSLAQNIARAFTQLFNIKLHFLCVYGSHVKPSCGIHASTVSSCIASAMFKLAMGEIDGPLYVADVHGRPVCRCSGGRTWLGLESQFEPSLSEQMVMKHLKVDVKTADETYRSVGRIRPIGSHVVISRCEDIHEDPEVKCIVCFAEASKIRDICGVVHFQAREFLGQIRVPWGPSCATLVTYPAGMAECAPQDCVFLGPTDPSAKEWLPEGYLALGIPIEIARMITKC
ncbi:MAG TPA: DUF169 domain-containing protein [Methanothrix sp.]|nr:DUF169 domain-containing protein [Methanothrix sp.]HOK59142.1 DUF169 domain-containing protein [Methanothrix sp.]HOL44498.1 DUF169 domain-containing protein [Methanothrix sp.]